MEGGSVLQHAVADVSGTHKVGAEAAESEGKPSIHRQEMIKKQSTINGLQSSKMNYTSDNLDLQYVVFGVPMDSGSRLYRYADRCISFG